MKANTHCLQNEQIKQSPTLHVMWIFTLKFVIIGYNTFGNEVYEMWYYTGYIRSSEYCDSAIKIHKSACRPGKLMGIVWRWRNDITHEGCGYSWHGRSLQLFVSEWKGEWHACRSLTDDGRKWNVQTISGTKARLYLNGNDDIYPWPLLIHFISFSLASLASRSEICARTPTGLENTQGSRRTYCLYLQVAPQRNLRTPASVWRDCHCSSVAYGINDDFANK